MKNDINRESRWKVVKLQSNFKLSLDKRYRVLNNWALSFVGQTSNLSRAVTFQSFFVKTSKK